MAKAPPAFQLYPQDFLVGTAGISHSSVATYITLLCYEWTLVNVPFDRDKLARMCRISREEFDKDWSELEEKFTVRDDGCIHNNRLEAIRREVLTRSEKYQEAGRKGGNEKARKRASSQATARLQPGSSSSVFRLQTSFKDNPLPPLLENEAFRSTLGSWLEYKKWKYKEPGYRTLLTRAEKRAKACGVQAVIDAMEAAMANNNQGWDYDSQFRNNTPQKKTLDERLDAIFEKDRQK